MVVRQDEDVADAFILQEAAIEAKRQGAGEGINVSELLGDYEGEAEPIVEPRAMRRTRSTIVETSESEPKERPRAQLSITGSRATPSKNGFRVDAITNRIVFGLYDNNPLITNP